MEIRNIWKNISPPLEIHKDNRGAITDIFYNENINHVAVISSKKGCRRGDHYHKQTVQHILITKGSLVYVYKPVKDDEPVRHVLIKEGEIITTKPFEIHTLLFPEDNEFVVFSQGIRGGQDYEKDTFRTEPLEIPKEIKNLVSNSSELLRREHKIKTD